MFRLQATRQLVLKMINKSLLSRYVIVEKYLSLQMQALHAPLITKLLIDLTLTIPNYQTKSPYYYVETKDE